VNPKSKLSQRKPFYNAWRFYFILSIISLVVLGLIVRVFDLAILNQYFLRHQGDERVLRLINMPAFRGMIIDRNGFPLAVSTSVYSLWFNPKEFLIKPAQLSTLSLFAGISQQSIKDLIKRNQQKKREFVYLKRGLSPAIAKKIKTLNIPGLYLQEEYRRFYPEGEATAHIVGLTNIDDQGQEGLELAYNQWLAGEPGKKWVMKDRIGRIISDVQVMRNQKAGRDVVLSIDKRIQYLAYRELIAGINQSEASSGSVVVLDIKTGEILAMANYPSFDPNERPVKNREAIRNRAITDTFEPGSTMKAFTVASGLESRRFKLDSIINTAPGWMRVGHNVVHDEKNNGLLTLTQILQISSNMGAAKIVLALPPNQLWDLLHRVGFGEVTGVAFPGEQNGVLIQHHPWGSFTLATLSFGYGMTVTALQLARAYAILGNEGIKLPVSLLRLEQKPKGEAVIEPQIAKQMLMLLESVLAKGGTAVAARVPGYRVAGKTGTAWKVGEGGYQKHRYTSSFVGIAPISHPRLVVAVIIHDPRGKQYLGGFVSGPVFAKIMEGSLRMLDIPPDELSASS
jgi:cell division protein FtsI (penicillin-binding protein 3)